MKRRMGWRTGFVALLAGAALSAGCSYSSPGFKATRLSQVASDAPVPIRVRSANGSIEIQAGPGAAVEITATIRAVSQDRLDRTEVLSGIGPDGVLEIGVAWADGVRKNNEGCSFDITTPWATNVDVESSNGAITLSGMVGSSRVETSNGSVHVVGHDGPLDVHTSNGALAIVHAGAGPIRARTSNGGVQFTTTREMGGSLQIRTSNGSIAVASDSKPATKQPGTTVRLRLGDGDTQSSVRTSNGSVSVTIADESL